MAMRHIGTCFISFTDFDFHAVQFVIAVGVDQSPSVYASDKTATDRGHKTMPRVTIAL